MVSIKRNFDTASDSLKEKKNLQAAGDKECKKLIANIQSNLSQLRRQEDLIKQLERDCKDTEKEPLRHLLYF